MSSNKKIVFEEYIIETLYGSQIKFPKDLENLIRKYLTVTKTSPRGNTQLKQFVCSLIYSICGKYLDPNDFIIHHKNGDSNDNTVENIALLPKSMHENLHNTIKNMVANDKNYLPLFNQLLDIYNKNQDLNNPQLISVLETIKKLYNNTLKHTPSLIKSVGGYDVSEFI